MYEIDFCTTGDGKVPMEEYLDSLPPKIKAKTLRSIALLREYGKDLREPHTKPLGDGLFELRTSLGSDSGRSMFFYFAGETIVLTHGFIKKRNKAPRREIKRAERLRSEYIAKR